MTSGNDPLLTPPAVSGADRPAVACVHYERRVKASDDLREGVTAFFEKRPPRWTGR